ncbi:hypothetical protein TRFO_39958 [Tritrichomonas foetus]|uniref:Elongin-A n=1 Tax=Tritrichomonas foetus TaxID=1144522 RepID=A0A1J4J3G7_9EUKA|nr:hypothetical protein TRFO_39958 [Tritrichomonas foetus]|eukprot:OHS93898.1 hypothetical protein TRFO_39958 [Tritrichomonas foetus]
MRTTRLKTLKEICLEKIQRYDPAYVSFVGIPPHLINQILKNVNSPQSLARIQDQEANKDSVEFAEAIDERWHEFVLSKFWVGKKTEPELPKNCTWRMFYDDLERQQKEILENQRLKNEMQKKKEKKSKIFDPKTAEKVFKANPNTRPSKSYYSGRSSSVGHKPNVGSLGNDLLKKLSKYHH